MMTIRELPEPTPADDPQGLRILPYVTVYTLEHFADDGGFPPEYIPHLREAVRRICELDLGQLDDADRARKGSP